MIGILAKKPSVKTKRTRETLPTVKRVMIKALCHDHILPPEFTGIYWIDISLRTVPISMVLKQALTNTRTMPATEAPTPIQSIFLIFSFQLPVTGFKGRRNRSITKHAEARIEGTQKTHLQPSDPVDDFGVSISIVGSALSSEIRFISRYLSRHVSQLDNQEEIGN